jgi:hypothetical protein
MYPFRHPFFHEALSFQESLPIDNRMTDVLRTYRFITAFTILTLDKYSCIYLVGKYFIHASLSPPFAFRSGDTFFIKPSNYLC